MTEREQLEVDVVIVGAGPAGLAAAIRLGQLSRARGGELSVMVIEKAAEIGNHGISGAVLDPRSLDELLPEWRKTAPLEAPVASDALWYLTRSGKISSPLIPPMLDNRGKYVVSLQKLSVWLAAAAAELGVDVLPSFPGQDLLWEGQRVVGVRVGDKGVNREGRPKANFEPGPELRAKLVLLAEGPRGTLAKQAIAQLKLDAGRDPQVYAVGVKEIWRCPPGRVRAGSVIHTLGAPLNARTFGGGFIYGMAGDLLDIGFVTGLDYEDPTTDPHDVFQRFKLHPEIKPMLEGAQLVRYGAKAIPEGGLFSMPRFFADGLLLLGDSAGFLNGMRLKGIHLAIKSGMLAAETAFEAIAGGSCDAAALARMEERFKASWAYQELRAARNFHAGFEHGLLPGMLNVGLGMFTGGRGFGLREHLPNHAGYARMRRIADQTGTWERDARVTPDNLVTFDKLTDVFHSGTKHDEDQPCHLHVADVSICAQRCTAEYGNPCQYFCPAKVYEPLFERKDGQVEGRLQINFANCVHCKTCDIMDPYQIITWVPPQGGDGPVYTNM